MGWAIGFDSHWGRDIGYGVPAQCDFPRCPEQIDRGLVFVCGGAPYGGEHGCGLYFCYSHLETTPRRPQRCSRCRNYRPPFLPKPDIQEWVDFKATDESWAAWRAEQAATR